LFSLLSLINQQRAVRLKHRKSKSYLENKFTLPADADAFSITARQLGRAVIFCRGRCGRLAPLHLPRRSMRFMVAACRTKKERLQGALF